LGRKNGFNNHHLCRDRKHHDARTSPALAGNAQEIATASLEAQSAGASIVHIHVRDPETGRPSMDLEHYREVVERIRKRNADLVITLRPGLAGASFRAMMTRKSRRPDPRSRPPNVVSSM
jgi:uncharacterized protein (DUF849 family)